jgi:hypothetical protein
MPDFNLSNIRSARLLSQCMDCAFKSTKKLNRDILDSLNKSTIPCGCRFPLTNPHSVESLHFVPESNLLNWLMLFCICLVNLKSDRPFFAINCKISWTARILYAVYSRLLMFDWIMASRLADISLCWPAWGEAPAPPPSASSRWLNRILWN